MSKKVIIILCGLVIFTVVIWVFPMMFSSKNSFAKSYYSCGGGYGSFTLHKDGTATHHKYGSNYVKGSWKSENNRVFIYGIPDYEGTYFLDGTNNGVAIKSQSTGLRYCSE